MQRGKKKSSRASWSSDEDSQLKRLFHDERPISSISQQMARSEDAVKRRIKKLKISSSAGQFFRNIFNEITNKRK